MICYTTIEETRDPILSFDGRGDTISYTLCYDREVGPFLAKHF